MLIRDVTILTAAGRRIERGWLRLRAGRIFALGEGQAPATEAGETVIDAKGQYATPGLIDTHSHMGVYPVPNVWAHGDGNEMTSPITAGVRSEEAFWPQDPALQRAVAGGVTTIQVLPGSANLMGGRSVTLKLHPRRSTRAMRFPGAPDGLKMACGENPKRVYGLHKQTMPASRMGNLFLMRQKWSAARRYRRRWQKWRDNPHPDGQSQEAHAVDAGIDGRNTKEPPKRDLVLETLARVLDGEILVHIHCYRADEMILQLELAEEFGFHVRSFHHAVEAYKIRDILAQKKVSVSTWADWWGFKIEAWDGIEQNLALIEEAGGLAVVHTDSTEGVQRMNQEAGKAYHTGLASGIALTEDAALRWITANPAWTLGIEDQTGTLEVGKMADVTLWDAHPFSVYTRATRVFIDGHLRFDRERPETSRWSDFEVGL